MNLKPCPNCESDSVLLLGTLGIKCPKCELFMPFPYAEQWNALPRKGDAVIVRAESGVQNIVPTAYAPTRRDYFAAKALAGLLADPKIDDSSEDIAFAAARCVDAIIARLDATEAKP